MRRDDPAVRRLGLLTLLLVLVIAGMAPLTYAAPPDPSWLGGYWDDDDFDDVVILLDGMAAVVPSLTVVPAPPIEIVAVVECHEPLLAGISVDESANPRAPPRPVPAS